MEVVAIVGRPNVGKSALFNKLTGKRNSIVEDVSGVTRDRIYGECEWRNRKFLLVDTGGIEPDSKELIPAKIRQQANLAIETAKVIIFVTDIRSGLLPDDEEIGSMLQKSGKHVVLCVNKCDKIGEQDASFYEFYNLGLGDPIAVSSVHGHGTGDVLDCVLEYLEDEDSEYEENDRIKVALIGKPNVGKSSLLNKISGEERSIVSNIAGTTRDAVDNDIDNEFGKYTIIDTAGIRRQNKIEENIEKYSIIRAKLAIERSDVCVIMIDATEGFTEQDSKIAGLAHESGKAAIIAVNKWDAIEKDTFTMKKEEDKLKIDFSFMSYAPIVFISAKTGDRISRLFEMINIAANNNALRIKTGVLNEVLASATARMQPPSDKGRRLKIYYVTQSSTKPPTFVFFVNSKDLFHSSYQRYLENRIRETFGLRGTPVRFIVRERDDDSK